MSNSSCLLKMSEVNPASASRPARGTERTSARKRRLRLKESARNCGDSGLPGSTCSSQYRSTIRLKLSRGVAEFVAWEGAGAGAAPQAASPKNASPSKTLDENRVIDRL